MKYFMKKTIVFLVVLISLIFLFDMPVFAKNVTVVIDPGHGGENLGAQWDGRQEKDITLIVAKAMKQELEKYEGITVYLTREGDADLTLQERADFAEKKNADFLYSLHFNMSEYHTLYGTEIWVSAFGEGYSKGYAFGEIYLDKMTGLDLYERGIKTRLNKKGTDYYGIIRACTEYEIPSCILEHCFLDRPEDKGRHETEEKLQELGRLDATAVAQYYKLSSKELGVDYSDYPVSEVPVPTEVMKPDLTPPENCQLEIISIDEENAELTFSLSAEDTDSGILYYAYSIDDGLNFSELCMWNGDEAIEATISIPYGKQIKLVCHVLNGYDIESTTETISVNAIFEPQEVTEALSDEVVTPEEEKPVFKEEPDELMLVKKGETKQINNFTLVICIVGMSLLVSMFFVLILSKTMSKKKHKKRRR